jgi:Trichohyalin-plectin-homology domain
MSKSSNYCIVGKDTVVVLNRAKYAKRNNAPVMISASDLNRLANTCDFTEKERDNRLKRQIQAQRERELEEASSRKERMIRLEEQRKRNIELTDVEKLELAEKNAIIRKAKQAFDEQMDEVKSMNQMMLYAKVASIRENQVKEKAYLKQEAAEQERIADTVMEIERLKAIEMYEEREKRRIEDQRKGAAVIVQQITDRETEKQKELEELARERSYVLKQIEALKIEEQESVVARKRAAAKLMEQVNLANQESASLKEERKLLDKLEDERIIQYNKNREADEKRKEAEKQMEAERKEAELNKLRGRQEKARDRKSEIDALRARRAMDAAERAAREKTAREAARVEAINRELNAARIQQEHEKEEKLKQQAIEAAQEFERIVAVQKQYELADIKRAEEEKKVMKLHSEELMTQIQAKEEKELQDRRDALEEGNLIRTQMALERKKLEVIKQKKLDELKRSGVDKKYTAELINKKLFV